jgi:transcriptional regulator with XRE-family HTH domain
MTISHLTKLLVDKRKQFGWSQSQLAARMGWNPERIRRLETGKNLTLDNFLHWCEALDVRVRISMNNKVPYDKGKTGL